MWRELLWCWVCFCAALASVGLTNTWADSPQKRAKSLDHSTGRPSGGTHQQTSEEMANPSHVRHHIHRAHTHSHSWTHGHMELSEAEAQNQRWLHTGLNIGMYSLWAKNQPLPCSLCDTQTSLQHKLQKEQLKVRMGRRDTVSLRLP